MQILVTRLGLEGFRVSGFGFGVRVYWRQRLGLSVAKIGVPFRSFFSTCRKIGDLKGTLIWRTTHPKLRVIEGVGG